MIVDTSAVVAILKGEPERASLLDALTSGEVRRMSAASYVETAIVVDALGDPVKSRRLDEILSALDVEIVEVTSAQAVLARQAYRDYGKGRGTAPDSTLGTFSRTHKLQTLASRCFSRVMIFCLRHQVCYLKTLEIAQVCGNRDQVRNALVEFSSGVQPLRSAPHRKCGGSGCRGS